MCCLQIIFAQRGFSQFEVIDFLAKLAFGVFLVYPLIFIIRECEVYY